MGNLESTPVSRRASVPKSLAKRGSGTLRASRSSKKMDLNNVSAHDFSAVELEWLGHFFAGRFPKMPSFANLTQAFPSIFAGDNEPLMTELFRVLDRNANAVIDLDEFLYACSVTARGSLDRKLAFLFILCDVDEDRIVSREDVSRMVQRIGCFMIRDGALRKKFYSEKEALRAFKGSETLLMDRFKQRAGSNEVLDRCLGFFDVIFYPVIRAMENELGCAQMFGRPLPYLYLRENLHVPAILSSTLALLKGTEAAEIVRLLQWDEEKDLVAKLEREWVEVGADAMVKTIGEMSAKDAAPLLKAWLLRLPEPLVPFPLLEEALLAASGSQSAREQLVKRLPGIHASCLREVSRWITTLSASDQNLALLCSVLAPLIMRPKQGALSDNQRSSGAELIRLLVLEGELEPEADSAALVDARRLLSEANADIVMLREEKTELEEKMAAQSAASTKMAQRIAALRQELTTLKLERKESAELQSSSSTVLKTVAEWAEGATPASEKEALEAIARREKMQKSRATQRDPYAALLDGAADAVNITVTLICGRGLIGKDGKAESYQPKVTLVAVADGKVVRKKDALPVTSRTTDPDFHASFCFSVSRKALDQFAVQINIVHGDKLGREVFLGVVDVPLEDVAQSHLEDWFPLKQKKATDKVSGEVHIIVANDGLDSEAPSAEEYMADSSDGSQTPKSYRGSNSARSTPSTPPSGRLSSSSQRIEVYAALMASNDSVRGMTLKLSLKATKEYVAKLYQEDPPNTADHILFDESNPSLIMAASRAKLFALICGQTRPGPKDPDFVMDTLLTISFWIDPSDFLLELFARYSGPDMADNFEQYGRWELQSKSLQDQVFKVLFQWLNNPLLGQDFFKSPGLKEMLLSYSQEMGISLRALNMTAKQSQAGLRARSNSVIAYEQKKDVRSRRDESVFELPPRTTAEQLTLIEHSLVSDIQLSELSGQAWSRDGKETKAQNVLTYIAWFNRVSSWIVTQIMSMPDTLQRAIAIVKFIDIGVALNALQNFNGAVEVLSALHSSAIARLKDTWALVPKEKMTALEELDLLMSTDGNFRFYRALLEKSKPPVVPYLGLMLTDLTFLDDANLTELGKGDAKLLNVDKLRMLASVFRLFRRCVSKPYVLPEVRSVRKLLMNVEGFDENELYRLSKLRESGGSDPASLNAIQDLRKQRKLISQITSSMLTRTKLDVKDDCMSPKDWKQLLSMDGVQLKAPEKGKVIFDVGVGLKSLFKVHSGHVDLFLDEGDDEPIYKTEGVAGALAILLPHFPSKLLGRAGGDLCQLYRIPPGVVHSFCSDPEQSRRFYASLAQNQVELLLGLNACGRLKPMKKALMEPLLGTWDVEFFSDSSGADFRFLGRFMLTSNSVILASKMLGFLNRNVLPLGSLKVCEMQGSQGILLSVDGKGTAKRCSFKCLSGSMDTEKVIKAVEESREEGQKQGFPDSDESESSSGTLAPSGQDYMALTNADWAALTEGAKRVVLKEGEIVMLEGGEYQRMYQVVRGTLHVKKQIGDEEKTLGELHCSDTFGEISFLTGSKASASVVVATEECELIIIESYYVSSLINIRREMGGRLYKFLAMLITARITEKFA